MSLCESNVWFYFSWIFAALSINFWFFSFAAHGALTFYDGSIRPSWIIPTKFLPYVLTIVSVLVGISAALIQLVGGWAFNTSTLTIFLVFLFVNALWLPIQFLINNRNLPILWSVGCLIYAWVVFGVFISENFEASAIWFIGQLVWNLHAVYLSYSARNTLIVMNNNNINNQRGFDLDPRLKP